MPRITAVTAVRSLRRRDALLALSATMAGAGREAHAAPAAAPAAERRWFEHAARMKALAVSSGDQPYGAVLVLDGRVVGEGPSRVVRHGDATAHAEREALRDAMRRLGREKLDGAVLVSTSRPCAACEAAAAGAGVARMVWGESLHEAAPARR